MKDDLLEKEKRISDSVKVLRKQLVEREAVLFSFDEYEKLKKEIDRLNAEIELINSTPFYDNTKEPLGSRDVFCMPLAIYEMPVQEYHVDNRERYASLKAGIFLGIVACTFPASSSVPACKASSASFDMSLSTGVSFRRSNGT